MPSLAISSILGFLAGLLLVVRVRFHEERSPMRSALGWFLLAAAAECLAMALLLSPYATVAVSLELHRFRILTTVIWAGALLKFSLIYGRGDYPEVLRRWRVPLRVVTIAPPLVLLGSWSTVARVVWLEGDSPRPFLVQGFGGQAAELLVILLGILVLMNLERTLRVSIGTMRWRLKYTVLGIGLFTVVRLFTATQELLHATVVLSWLTLDALAFVLCCAMLALSRRRGTLLNIDLYPSQRMIYQSLTLGLAGLYLLIIGLLAVVGSWLKVNTWLPLNSLLVLLAMVGVAVVLMSDRVRQRTKQWASANFLRPRHDYRRVWLRFTEQTRTIAEVAPFCRATVELVAETLESLSVSLWLVEGERRELVLGGSTVLSGGTETHPPPAEATPAILAGMAGQHEPVDLNQGGEGWCQTLLESNPESFQTGQSLCMALRDGPHILGLLLAGDRVGHAPFSSEDRALLRTIGEHTAARLVTFRLSEGLLEAREFAALQKASAFFVHDLKNTATTLKLMLKNLTRHFDNEEFREDALHTMSSTVARIEAMISELTCLRDEEAMNLKPADLNRLVETVVNEVAQEESVTVETTLGELPPVPLDAARLRTVLTNLLANARDAGGEDTRVEVSTARQHDQAVVTVRDHGPGMTREFIDTRLFRPFQSTKKNGLGIGLFHSRQIVDAHQGRIEVESEPGTGTAFRMILPLKEAE